jgi:hypothetical protein
MSAAELRKAFRARLTKRWRARLARECLKGERAFPLEVIIQKPDLSGKAVLSDVSMLRRWLDDWSNAALCIGVSLRIDNVTRAGQALRLPHSLTFDNADAVARYLGSDVQAEWQRAKQRLAQAHEIDSRLKGLSGSWAAISSVPKPDWEGLCGFLKWRLSSPDIRCFLREVPVPGLHTKWLEQNAPFVLKCLTLLDLSDPQGSCFAAKANFRSEDTRTLWMRLPAGGALPEGTEIAFRPSHLAHPPQGTERVLIVENLTTFRSFEPSPGTLVLFGSGNEFVSSIVDIAWLASLDVYYWGDIDLGGYEILSRLRARCSALKSIMMDCTTVEYNRNMIVNGPINRSIDQSHLTPNERSALEFVLDAGGRLEQERLRFNLSPLLDAGLAKRTEEPRMALAS